MRPCFDSWVKKIPWKRDRLPTPVFSGFPGGSDGKECTCGAGDMRSVLGSGRSPGEGNGYPLQYSCLENSIYGGAWWATVHGVAKTTKSRTRLSDFTFTFTRPLSPQYPFGARIPILTLQCSFRKGNHSIYPPTLPFKHYLPYILGVRVIIKVKVLLTQSCLTL